MTLNQLKVFEAVASYVSITRASQALRISEPSVFQQVKLLEECIGTKLYRKVGRCIELTQDGRDVQTDIRSLLSIASKLEHRFRPNADSTSGRLVVGGSHAPSSIFLPSIIAAFKRHHPRVQVTLRTKTSSSIEKLILGSEVDIALITNPSHSPLLVANSYRTEDFVAFISVNHTFAKKSQLTLSDLENCPMIIKKHDESKGGSYARQMEAKGFQSNVLMECESAEAIKTAVMNGMGLGFLYRDHVKSEIKRGELKVVRIPALQKPTATSYIVYRKDHALSAEAQDFLDLLERAKPGLYRPIRNRSRVGHLGFKTQILTHDRTITMARTTT